VTGVERNLLAALLQARFAKFFGGAFPVRAVVLPRVAHCSDVLEFVDWILSCNCDGATQVAARKGVRDGCSDWFSGEGGGVGSP
jgi:hypothetical protein